MREPCYCGATDCRECGPLQGCDPGARECRKCGDLVSKTEWGEYEHDCDAESLEELARLREGSAECAGVGA